MKHALINQAVEAGLVGRFHTPRSFYPRSVYLSCRLSKFQAAMWID
jgi:hypothetical protein